MVYLGQLLYVKRHHETEYKMAVYLGEDSRNMGQFALADGTIQEKWVSDDIRFVKCRAASSPTGEAINYGPLCRFALGAPGVKIKTPDAILISAAISAAVLEEPAPPVPPSKQTEQKEPTYASDPDYYGD